MITERRTGWWFVASFLLLPQHASGVGVLGFHEPKPDFFVAVRARVPGGSTVTGIRFYSNDATVFPAVALAADRGELTLPEPGAMLRSARDVPGTPGYVTVALPAYPVVEDQDLWAIVRFPGTEGLRARGLGGGPGIGWREERGLDGERSFFAVDGSLNEFSPAFDIGFVLSIGAEVQAAKAEQGGSEEPGAGNDTPGTLSVLGKSREEGIRVQFLVPRAATVELAVYDVSGRLVRTLAKGSFAEGAHEIHWDCRNGMNGAIARGMYFLVLRTPQELSRRKVVVAR
jgi:hypothetical protein